MIDLSQLDTAKLKELRSRIDAILDGPVAGAEPSLEDAAAEFAALRQKVASTGKAAVCRAINQFMAKNPEVEAIRWKQYTPYFNDGDPCVFRVRDPEVKLSGGTGDEGDDEDGFQDSFSIRPWDDVRARSTPTPLSIDLDALGKLFDDAEDAMKATFGDHAQITVARGEDAEVEEYDHD